MPVALLQEWLRHRTGKFAAALGVGALLFILWVPFGSPRLPYSPAVAGLALPLMALVAATAAWRLGAHPALPGRAHLAWRAVAVALVCYGASDLVRAYYEVTLGLEAFPPKTHLGYVLFYPTMTLGLLSFPSASPEPGERQTLWLNAGIVLLGGWMVLWYFVLGPTVFAEQGDLTATVLAIAYPAGDLALILGVGTLLLRRHDEPRHTIRLLAAGIAAFLAADIAFGYRDLLGLYQPGDWPDALWMLAWFLIAASALFQSWASSSRPGADSGSPDEMEPASWLPHTAVVLGYALLFVAGRYAPLYPLGGLLYAAIAVAGLGLLRQVTLLAENRQLRSELRAVATIDSLTGLLSRREFFTLAEREFARHQRYGHMLSIILLHIDDLAAINAQSGPRAGDQVLQTVAELCRQELRKADLAGRYGGDELVLLLPETDLLDALRIAQRLQAVASERTLAFGPHLVKINFSAGVAPASGTHSLAAFLRRADGALAAAKHAGRNQIKLSSPPTP